MKNLQDWLKKIEYELNKQNSSVDLVFKNYQKYVSIQTFFEKYKEKFNKETQYFDKVFEKVSSDIERVKKFFPKYLARED